MAAAASTTKPDYGVDAPAVLRNFLLGGGLALLLALFGPRQLRVGPVLFLLGHSLFWPAGFLLGTGLLFLYYVKVGKFHHRDVMLDMYRWRGDEQVLDVGCGRGLLLAGAAKRLTATGHATGLDIWSNVDMGANSAAATAHNLELEGLSERCTLVSAGAQAMPFADASFDVVVSNLCLHNIEDRATRRQALDQIVRVLRPGGTALVSDYIKTAEYAAVFAEHGLTVERRFGAAFTIFPPLRVVIVRKPL